MAEIQTVAIHSPKDASIRWIINLPDYDPAKHVLWGHNAESSEEPKAAEQRVMPSVDDFMYAEDGSVEYVNIITPEQRNARKTIRFADFDPERHELWSTHPRFH